MGRKRKPQQPARYDLEYVRSCAARQWPAILSQVGGIDADLLDGNHHPCPKCGGTDRFRAIDLDAGALLCNNCARTGNGDGFASLSWLTGRKFAEVLAEVAGFLGIQPSTAAYSNGSTNGHAKSSSRSNADPAEHLSFQPWNDGTEALAALWCLSKPPITPAAIRAVGGSIARYRDKYTVIALPIWGSDWAEPIARPCGYSLYNITGGTLPKWGKPKADGSFDPPKQVKVKLTHGSKPGIIADRERLKASASVWKLEGPSDLLAFLSLPDLPGEAAAVTNANGAGELPAPWMLELFDDRLARVCHDADEPGQRGAVTHVDQDSGKERPGWANLIAKSAAECRNVVPPYPLEKTHGKDLRDWIADGANYKTLADEAAATLPIPVDQQAEAPPPAPADPIESPDNYHRLARINLERYRRDTTNGMLRYWRNEWYKYDGFCYRKIDETELKAKVGQAVREEFERLSAEEMAAWDGEGKMPVVRNVGHALVSNVLFATSQMCILSGTVELNTWTEGPLKGSRDRYVALKNGILNIDALLAGRDDYIIPHSSNWFSVTCLPFNFDIEADAPTWKAFLNRNLEGDAERISLLKEWAGYLLLPNTDYQKFVFFEGEGANGKSVYLAAIEAMLGEYNCSHVSLEAFSKDFILTQTLGKLANIASECSEMDSVAEGLLKAVASGDRMTFNRKGIPPIEATPTARLMLSANVRPRFADKSSGLWRRMMLVPWRVVIPEGQRIIGMDKVGWWERSGELPGIFNWALAGLAQLSRQKAFTKSRVCEEALADYRKEMNTARAFLDEFYIEDSKSEISTLDVYDAYKEWTLEKGYRPVSDGTFGREVSRKFEKSQKARRWSMKDEHGIRKRYYVYAGIRQLVRDDDPGEDQESEAKQPEELFV